ncbi:MAG: istB-like binding family protein, partial [Glaciihabitans sp.]|nr:istB-like binding family protein [Glaciihabitans sp.]
MVDIRADLTSVKVVLDGKVVAVHRRSWNTGQIITDPAHVAGAKVMRERFQHPAAVEEDTLIRDLAEYDTAFGVDLAAETIKQLDYLGRALKAPRIRQAALRLADQARTDGWSHEEYLAAVLEQEVSAREASGGDMRIRSAGFPARKTLEDFSFDSQPSLRRDTIAHLSAGSYLSTADNIVLLGPPGTGKTHLAIGLGIKAAQTGHRVLFATAIDWVARLQSAHLQGRLSIELARLRRYGLIIVDEVGYIPFEQDAANLFFQLVSSRYEHASLILTSNLAFARWGDVFGDQVVAAAMIDRIVHHADVLTLKGSSYRLRNSGIDTLPSARAENA